MKRRLPDKSGSEIRCSGRMLCPEDEYVSVELRPFPHQVSGSHMILEINESSICKPYSDREVNFYNYLPLELREFTPNFQGVIDVTCYQCKEGIVFNGDIPRTIAKTSDVNDRSVLYLFNSRGDENKNGLNKKHESGGWNHECIDRHIRSCSMNSSQKFIILGNLLETYERPCVLDIKLGRRQRAYFRTEANRQKHEDRCTYSTSSSLSFRINGTQVYKIDINSFIKHDKFHGRKLDLQGVKDELQFFFHNGIRLRTDVINYVVEKLKCLKQVLTNQNKFHFFACSLLLLYDGIQNKHSSINNEVENIKEYPVRNGCVKSECSGKTLKEKQSTEKYLSSNLRDDSKPKADVKLIDFGHTFQRDHIDTNLDSNDLDLLNALQNLIDILEQFL